MKVFNLQGFPFTEFGENPVRKVRLLVSPQTTGEQRCSVVVSSIPPGGLSEGHLHNGSEVMNISILISEVNLLSTEKSTK